MAATPAPSPAPSSANNSPMFEGPTGWHYVRGAAPGTWTWLHQGDTDYTQNVVVEAKKGLGAQEDVENIEMTYARGLPDMVAGPAHHTKVCGNHRALYLSYTWTGANDVPVTTDEVVTVYGSTAFVARYNRAMYQPLIAAAENSLMTLCGEKS